MTNSYAIKLGGDGGCASTTSQSQKTDKVFVIQVDSRNLFITRTLMTK